MRPHSKALLITMSTVMACVIASYVMREIAFVRPKEKAGTRKLLPKEDQSLLPFNRHVSRGAQFDENKKGYSKSNTRTPTTFKPATVKIPTTTSNTTSFMTSCGKFHLITTYFVGIPTELNTSHFKNVANFFGKQYHDFSQKQFSERNKEYVDTLQHNLNHPCVEMIHLFYVKEKDLKTLTDSNLKNFEKVQPVKHERALHMADFFLYASRNLVGKPVVALNGDIELEDGFEKIDVKKMLDKKLLYSLSRYERSPGCRAGGDMCSNHYRGSHDCHIFALAEPFNESLVADKLDIPINMYQSENGMISTMRNILKFNVTNPCYDVKVYHHHCSKVHGLRDPNYSIRSIGWKPTQYSSGRAPPTTL